MATAFNNVARQQMLDDYYSASNAAGHGAAWTLWLLKETLTNINTASSSPGIANLTGANLNTNGQATTTPGNFSDAGSWTIAFNASSLNTSTNTVTRSNQAVSMTAGATACTVQAYAITKGTTLATAQVIAVGDFSAPTSVASSGSTWTVPAGSITLTLSAT